jgi:single-stranded DNA-binding protein
MINMEPFKAKLVRDPELRETKRGPVCNMRVRQVDPGKPSLFIDVAVFEEALAQSCTEELHKGAEVEIAGGLIYGEWEVKGSGKAKPQTRSKHSVVARTVAYETA